MGQALGKKIQVNSHRIPAFLESFAPWLLFLHMMMMMMMMIAFSLEHRSRMKLM